MSARLTPLSRRVDGLAVCAHGEDAPRFLERSHTRRLEYASGTAVSSADGSVTHGSGTHGSLCQCLEDAVGLNGFVRIVWNDSLWDAEHPFIVREFTATVGGDLPLPDVWGP